MELELVGWLFGWVDGVGDATMENKISQLLLIMKYLKKSACAMKFAQQEIWLGFK